MKRVLLVVAAACLAIPLAGCETAKALLQPLHSEQAVATEAPALRTARIAVDEANASLTALNIVIGQNAETMVWTKAEAQAVLVVSKGYGERVDKARELLRGGLLTDAQSQAEAVKALILTLHKRAAEAARKGK